MDKVTGRILAAVGGVAALVPGSASASVVVVPVNSGFLSSYTTTVVGHSLDWSFTSFEGPIDFLDPRSGTYILSYYGDRTDVFTGTGLSFTSGPLQPAGTVFDASDSYVSSEMVQEKRHSATLFPDGLGGYYPDYVTSYNGPWTPDGTGYIGLTIDIGGQTHYGWAQFSSFNFFTNLNFIAYAYDTTPNEAVVAGSPGVPEPMSLALLAGGLAGLTALRRRNTQKKAVAR